MNEKIRDIFLFAMFAAILGIVFKNIQEKKKSMVENLAMNQKSEVKAKIDTIVNSKAQSRFETQQRQYVYLDIVVSNQTMGDKQFRVIVECFNDIVPKTAKNFIELCKRKKYVNTKFHRIVKDFVIQGGDYENGDGSGGKSIYGETFDDENFELKHSEEGLISMANSGPNTNGSQFFINLKANNHLDGKHVVFGKVVNGMDRIYQISSVDVDFSDAPLDDIYIKACGEYKK